ncbi:MAG: WYL domain-containing transcriptional regulator [Deltaproteobacteria bacterium]|nr:WYL domain-containing transcriptional regulator [Deltaproteobacteria bacterium]
MRGDQLARQWRVIRAIEASTNGLTVAEIANREETGIRTIYRDLEALQSAGFPLYTEKVDKANRWAFVDTYKFKIPAPFTLTELMSLYFYKDLVRVFKGTPFHDSIDSVFKKIQSTLPPQALRYLDEMQSVFHVGIKPYKDYGQFRNILNQVNQAAMERRRVEMVYHSLHRKERTLRKVDPYKVWFYDGTIYLIGLCHLREEVRMFVLDRIKMLKVTEDRFTVSKDFSLDDFMRHSFKVMHDELYTVRVRISSGWARWVGEKIWHESQKIIKLPGGGLEITFRVAGLDEIKRWILSFGPECQVLEPAKLKEMVRKDLEATLQQYRGIRAKARAEIRDVQAPI